jgi:hypothetical protein
MKHLLCTEKYQNINNAKYWEVHRMATGWTVEGLEFEPQKGQDFSPLHVFETGSGAHPAQNPMGNGSSFSGSKEDGTWRWPLTSN